MFPDINVWKQHHEGKNEGICLGRILGVCEETQGQGRVCEDKREEAVEWKQSFLG